jgi:phytoene desaturase
MKKHIVVVGAGPGGLSCAMILARRGFAVTVVESKDTVGGRNAPLHLGQYTFDRGPTFLMMDFILREIFQEAGRNIDDYCTLTRLETLYDLRFDDGNLESTLDQTALQAAIDRLFPGNAGAVKSFMQKEARRYEKLFPCLQKDYSSITSLFSPTLLKALPHLSIGKSMIDLLGTYFRQEKAKLAFTFQSKYLGMSAWDCPALFTMIPYVEHQYGICHVTGGLHRISAAMAQVLAEHGGHIRLSAPVASLVIENRAVKGVRLSSGETIDADEVVVNADFAHAMTTLVPPGVLKKYRAENLARKDYSCSAFMLYLGVNKRYQTAHHTIVFAKNYRTNVEDIFHRKITSPEISLYVQNPVVTDPAAAPDGKSGIYVLVPAPNLTGPTDWNQNRQHYRDLAIETIMRRTAMTDLKDHIEIEKIVTPADWRDEHHVYQGAVFNLAHHISQLLYFRPHNKFEELEHCYLVGGGTHPGSGLPTIYESARISANLICRAHGVAFTPPSPLSAK